MVALIGQLLSVHGAEKGAKSNVNIIERLFKKLDYVTKFSHRHFVAQRRDAPQSVLALFSLDGDPDVRDRIAGNPSTPKSVLIRLASDMRWSVRYRLADNPSTPKFVLTKLSKDANADVRHTVAMNLNTPKTILKKLSNDQDIGVSLQALHTLKELTDWR